MFRLLPLAAILLALAASPFARPTSQRQADPLGTFATLDGPTAIAELADGRVLIGEGNADRVLAFELDGTPLGTFASVASPLSLAQLADGRVLVGSNSGDEVVAFAADGAPLGTFASAIALPAGILQLPDGRILISDGGANRILAFDPDGTPLGTFGRRTVGPGDLTQLADGRILVTEVNEISAFADDGTSLGTFTRAFDSRPVDILQLADGNVLVVEIFRLVALFDTDGSRLGTFASGSGNVRAAAQLSDSRVLISYLDEDVVEAFEPTIDTSADLSIAVNTFDNDPMRGESIFFRGPVTNNGAATADAYVYFEVMSPTGAMQKRNLGRVTLSPGQTFKYKDFAGSKNRVALPPSAPAGTYTVTVYAASDRFGTTVFDQDSFQFTLPPNNTLMSASVPTASNLEIIEPHAAPNPFRAETEIRYALTEAAEVDLRVYDVTGREVAALVSGSQSAGTHAATLRAGDLPGGVYVWRLAVGGEVTTGRVTLAR